MIPRMLAFAALSGPLPKAGVVVVALLAALALLAPRRRSAAGRWRCSGALVLSPVLLLSDIWNSPQLRLVHRHPLPALVGAVVALAVAGRGRWLIARRPALFAPLAVLALPFRVPIQAGGTDLEPAGPAVPRGRGRGAGLDRAALAEAGGRAGRGFSRGRGPPRRRSVPSRRRPPARRRLPCLGRAAAGALRRPLRRPGDLLAGLREGAAADGLLLRPVHSALRAAAQPRLDARAAPRACGCWSSLAVVFSRDRLRRVRDQDDHPQLQAGRRQRPAHLLHRQLGVLRPRHLRPLSGAGDDPAGRAAALRRARGASSWRSSPRWPSCGRAWC